MIISTLHPPGSPGEKRRVAMHVLLVYNTRKEKTDQKEKKKRKGLRIYVKIPTPLQFQSASGGEYMHADFSRLPKNKMK